MGTRAVILKTYIFLYGKLHMIQGINVKIFYFIPFFFLNSHVFSQL